MKRLTTEDFKNKFKEKYGDLYDLSKVEYINNKTEVIVICPIHGEFKKRPDLLLDGCKCPKCSKTSKTSEEDFFEKARIVHDNFFEYEKGSFKDVSSKVGVICPLHGKWYPKANNHLRGMNCPTCAKEKNYHKLNKLNSNRKSSKTYDTKEFKKKIEAIHGDKFILDKVEYVNNKTKVTVTCREHGDFTITPNHLLSGRGCPKCSKNYHYSTKEIIEKFREVHGETYLYDNVEYVSTHANVIVTCKKHGDFEVSPSNHLRGEGCPKCNMKKLEIEIEKLLIDNNFNYVIHERNIPSLGGLELDFYLPDYKIAIECQGIQHFKPIEFFGGEKAFNILQENDRRKIESCKLDGIKLLHYSNLGIDYPYFVYEDKAVLLEKINEIINKSL